jgi:hypothetical protein
MRGFLIAGVLAATTLAAALPAGAQPGRSCFFATQWYGWKAPDDHTVYLNVGNNRVFKVDLAGACPALTTGDAKIVSIDRGSDGIICSPLDLDLHVSLGDHILTACIVHGLSELTPDQISAIPKNQRP